MLKSLFYENYKEYRILFTNTFNQKSKNRIHHNLSPYYNAVMQSFWVP